ncbi:hypothetical protein [Paraburkholderia sp. J11-2]|uniref:hypothetical protein n=1 Tax=Paraburkholderia sp. J11-2 TaxID=2805431 RepID=UPI002AB7F2D1|nr:hypothetical protein [Paraburkholderia sp. J11-2]
MNFAEKVVTGFGIWFIVVMFAWAFIHGATADHIPDRMKRARTLSWKDFPKEEV